MMAAPAYGGPGNGPWQLAVAAVDLNGNPISGLLVSLDASEGTLSQGQGTTDIRGTLTASISPPNLYSGEAVVVSATADNQTAAINIVFASSEFNPALSRVRREPRPLAGTPSNGTPVL